MPQCPESLGGVSPPQTSAQPSDPHLGHAGELVVHTEEERDQCTLHLPPHLLLIPTHHGPQQVSDEPEGELSQLATLLLAWREGEGEGLGSRGVCTQQLPAHGCSEADAPGQIPEQAQAALGCKAKIHCRRAGPALSAAVRAGLSSPS